MTTEQDKGRAQQAKGSVKEAIGKIIGDATVAREGLEESKAGARKAGRASSPPNDKDSDRS